MAIQEEQFKAALPILSTLTKRGFEAYFVGGCVRDYLLQRPIKDIDITTNATPIELEAIFDKVIPVGIEHGTVIVRHAHTSYEVTTFRNKKTPMGALEFGSNLADDLLYRDFTMNALAMDQKGAIIDLFDGSIDLKNKQIAGVQNPYMRLKEDPLRMVRACRFVSQLGFTIEKKTLLAIKQLSDELSSIAIERIKDEMTLLISGEHFAKALAYLLETNLLRQMPIFKEECNYIELLQKEKQKFYSFPHMIAFLYNEDQTISLNKWIKKWHASNREKREAESLYEALKQYEKSGLTLLLVYHLEEALHKPFSRIIDTIYKETITEVELKLMQDQLVIKNRKDLKVSGHHLMRWFSNRQPGRWIEEMIKAIEYAVIMNEVNNDEHQIKEWILCHPLATN